MESDKARSIDPVSVLHSLYLSMAGSTILDIWIYMHLLPKEVKLLQPEK